MKPLAIIALCAFTLPAFAQKQELGLTLGGIFTGDRNTAAGTRFSLSSGKNLQASYGYRVVEAGPAKLYLGLHFLANDQRVVSSADRTLTRDVATLYITPDATLKFSAGPIQPWVSLGGGIAVYEQSKVRLDNLLNPSPRTVTHGVFMAGGGVDIPVLRFLALRGEVREFYSGNPSFNTQLKEGQSNVLVGGGFVLRWH